MPDSTPGTITFLFTDIEGSTRLWEAEPGRMADALDRHDRMARECVEAHGGRVVKTTGDGLHAVFGDPVAAVSAAVALQREVFAIGAAVGIAFKIRCGLHAGIAHERDGDYFGAAVNRAARIMDAANGGQVLLSQSVVDLGRPRFPAAIDLLPLGRVRLRDLTAPEDVWQLRHADLPQAFPALRSLDSIPNNLPQQLTSFIGRERDIADVKSLLGRTRLLTLTGAGGCGKTRLALQVAADLVESFPDGVWLVELAALADPGLVPQTMASTLGLREETGRSLTQALQDHLRSRKLLLVLDNAEHVLAACAALVDAILRHGPHVRVLCTSREALGSGGEIRFRVPSLSLPDPRRDATPERLAQNDSARLFVERAQSSVPHFAVTADNAAALASICAKLDGIPLAIELAAARVRSMPVEEVSRRLDQRLRLLTGGSRTALPRHQTLRSLIDWSYDLLDEHERTLLCRLAVFAGGAAVVAAIEVCGSEGIEEWKALDLVTSLADKSLVQIEESSSASRFRMLETVRQYAKEKQPDADAPRWRDWHLAYFTRIAEEAGAHLSGADQQAWFNRLDQEHDNLRLALTWASAGHGDPVSGLVLAGALWRFWSVRGYPTEGRNWYAAVLAATPDAPAAARASAQSGAGVLAREQGDYVAARASHEESLALRRKIGDREGIASSLSNLGSVAHEQGDFPGAEALYEESLAIRRELGDRQGMATSLNNLGLLARERGDYPTARRFHEASLALDREIGDRRHIAVSLNNLGGMAGDQGDYAAACALHEESLAIRRELGDRRGIASSLTNLGDVAHEQGELARARALVEEGLAIRRELGDRRGIAISLGILGSIAHNQGDLAAAKAYHKESLGIRRELGDRWGIASSVNYLGVVACDEGKTAVAWACFVEGLRLSRALRDRWGLSEALGGLAAAALGLHGPLHAARFWGAAERLREEISAPLKPSEQPHYERHLAAARSAAIDPAPFEAAWREGRTLPLEQLLDDTLGTPPPPT